MRIEFVRTEFAKSVPCEASRIVDQQFYRAVRSGKYRFGAAWIAKVGHNFRRPFGDLIFVMVNMSDHPPAVADQCGGEMSTDALAGAGNYRCASFGHGSSLRRFGDDDNTA